MIDPIKLRNALGQFATGVTIITTTDETGAKVGLTANSFSSVSLDPPLVLWSLAKTANSMPVFLKSEHFAIHVLHSGQREVSNHFASKAVDKFSSVDTETGLHGLPLLSECAARFQCKKAYEYEGGDHVIFVGEVLDYQQIEKDPLLFHGGKYAQAREHDDSIATEDNESHSFSEDFLMYLLERVTPQVTLPFHKATNDAGLSLCGMRILALLSISGNRSKENILLLNPLETADIDAEIASLESQELISLANGKLHIEPAGHDVIVRLLAAGKAAEADALQDLSSYEQYMFKHLLKKVIARTDLGIPDPFNPQ